MNIDFTITKKQQQFIKATADEVLYGGAAGGGKSYGQLIDAFLYALKYKGSKQLILRRTFPELERSLILVSLEIYPQQICKYKENKHRWHFINGSFIEFGYCDNEKDVTRYQGAEFDVIRFDELTHFTEFQYKYLISRIRGVNPYPKQIKCSTNPGGVGHTWVKSKFIEGKVPGQEYTDETGRKIVFIPAKVQENKFLMESDPNYIKRLEQLPEAEKKALLEGEWDIFEGQFFPEFKKEIHTVKPFDIPKNWNRFRSLDYGLDMTACYWWAVAPNGQEYIYRELHQPGLILSQAAQKINELTPKDENIEYTVASPDLWNRRQDTGYSGAEIFLQNDIYIRKADNNRIAGWRAFREHLKTYTGEEGKETATLQIFNTCHNAIRCIPSLLHDEHNSEDAANEPHEVTHAPESIRYGIMSRPQPTVIRQERKELPYAFRSNEPQGGEYITW